MALPLIEKNLDIIDSFYNKSNDPNEQKLYSKQAIIELCGWIENEEDSLVRRIVKKFNRDPIYLSRIEKELIKKNYSLDHEKFLKMLRYLIGDLNIKRIERKLNNLDYDKFKNILKRLKEMRDDAAHNDLGHAQKSYSAPSITKADYLWLKGYFPMIKRRFISVSVTR